MLNFLLIIAIFVIIAFQQKDIIKLKKQVKQFIGNQNNIKNKIISNTEENETSQTSQKQSSKLTKKDESTFSPQYFQNLSSENFNFKLKTNQKENENVFKKDISKGFSVWIKENTLMKIGAFFIFLAISWFAQYAIAQGWIGVVGRITLGLLFGLILMLAGFRDAYKNKDRGFVLLGLGVSIILLITNIARVMYHLMTPEIALILMLIAVIFVFFVAIKFNNTYLAGFSFALAMLIPILTNSPHPSFFNLFSYLLILILGSLWIIYWKQWHFLVTEAFFGVSLYSILSFINWDISSFETLFAYSFALIFLIVSIIALIKNDYISQKKEKEIKVYYLLFSLINSLFIFTWTITGIPDYLQSVYLIVWSTIFLLIGFSVFILTKKDSVFLIYGATAILFLGVATALELERDAWFLAFSLEATLAVIVTSLLTKKASSVNKTFLLFVIPFLFSLNVLDSYNWYNFGRSIFFFGAISLYIFIFLLIITGIFLRLFFQEEKNSPQTVISIIFSLVTFYIFSLIWLIPHTIFYNGDATVFSLVLYTLIGLMFYFNSFASHQKLFHIFGIITLIGVIMHLLLVDVWEMEVVSRIIVFIFVGMILISTAYLSKTHRNKKIE